MAYTLSVNDVEMAYRLILGREPESTKVVEQHRARWHNLDDLRNCFLESEEFNKLKSRPIQTDADFGDPLSIETNLDPPVLAQMFERVEKCWRSLGQTEPYWSVISADKYRASTFNEHTTEFYASGHGEVKRLVSWLVRNHIDPKGLQKCAEYGCGVGRVTPALSRQFDRVFAYDISQPHVDIARQRLLNDGHSNVTLKIIDTIASLSEMEPVDLIFSLIVLQHNPPPVIAHILRMLFRSLNSRGAAFFQLAVYAYGYSFDAKQYLRSASPSGTCEMHVLPQSEVFKIARDEGCAVLEVQPDLHIRTPQWVSNTFLIQRQ